MHHPSVLWEKLGTASSVLMFLKGSLNPEHSVNSHNDHAANLRHINTGSSGSYRSSTGSVSGPSTPTNNTPLVIPQPVKPTNKSGKSYHCKTCDQVKKARDQKGGGSQGT
uniref:Uncharacterized protein n=1 Tax=Magallana gigas TaxID=29159 RepID=A0A8W8JVF3_MAGGI